MDLSLDVAALAGSCLGFASTALMVVGVLALAFVFRRQLSSVLKAASGRLQKVTIAGIAFELSSVPTVLGPDMPDDLGQPIPYTEIDSSLMRSFAEQLQGTEPVEYSVVDLKSGRAWLSSRLFILSIVLARMRGVKALVFVADRGDVKHGFVGIAAPGDVRWALAQQCPWFEPAFAKAYSSIGNFQVVSASGKLTSADAHESAQPAVTLVRNFVQRIQKAKAPSSDWAELTHRAGEEPRAEHAQWLTVDRLRAILGSRLSGDAVTVGPQARESDRKLAIQVVDRKGSYVAQIDPQGAFERLLDRQRLIEGLARQVSARWTATAG